MTEQLAGRELARIDDWPVDTAAGVVVMAGEGPTWSVSHGPVDHVFPLASVTKLLVAYAVLVAVQEGAVELDEPAGPEGATVRHLLAHASGLEFGERRARRAPGERRVYSSAGYEVLAEVVGAATGFDFVDYLDEAVCAPLGMTRTRLAGPAGHAAVSTVRDMAAFAYELLAPRVLEPSLLAEARTVQYPGLAGVVPGYGPQDPCDWGLGFEIRDGKRPHWTGGDQSPATVGHFGQAGTFLWWDPDVRAVAVVLTDRPFGDWCRELWSSFNDRLAVAVRARERAADAIGG